MNSFRSHIILFSFLFCTTTSTAQSDLTGTWEGLMGHVIFQSKSGQFLQVNIIQNGDKICGYTYDSVISNVGDHCKAVFEGVYDKRKDLWVLTGTSFIENSGTHVFMRIKLRSDRREGKDKLEAEVGLKSSPDDWDQWDRPPGIIAGIFKLFGIDESNGLQADRPESLLLKRVSSKPPEMPPGISPCFPHLQKPKDSLKNETIAEKQQPPKTADPVAPVAVKKDSIKNIVYTPPPVKKNDTAATVQKMTERKNTVFSHLPVNVKNITLNIYDNAIVDGDTVTIFYNGKLLVNKRLLSEKPIVIELALDENAKTHEIVLYAENLGSIPPNTALVVVTAGDKRYELHASASLEENAVLVFDYEPKKN